jgi:NADH-quinone oxidoreductase subunit D
VTTLAAEVIGRSDEMILNLGPQHPATHGVLKVVLGVDGERITRAIAHMGFLHRNHEKIDEGRPYAHALPYLDRMDYLSGFQNELAYCLAVEDLIGAEVPRRAQFIRVAMCELNRIASHLVWLGTYMLDLGAITPFLYAFRDREILLDLFERTAGARMLPNYFTFGGVRRDLHPNFWEDSVAFCDYFETVLPEYRALVIDSPVFKARTVGVGVVSTERAIAMGASGPVARGSGAALDLRRTDPYEVYPELEFEVAVEQGGDAYSRSAVRFRELETSMQIVRQCARMAPRNGPFLGKVPRIIKASGERYRGIEASRGEMGVYIVGDGSNAPFRVKHRSPSFTNLQLLRETFEGAKFADAISILGSIDIVLGEVDR